MLTGVGLITLPPTQCIAAFEEGSFLPLPSREAVERSIGKGGNGTITVVYFKGVEFAVKRVSRSVCTYVSIYCLYSTGYMYVQGTCDMHMTLCLDTPLTHTILIRNTLPNERIPSIGDCAHSYVFCTHMELNTVISTIIVSNLLS